MQKTNKTKRIENLSSERISSYHGGEHERKLYFTSDRYEVLTENYERPNGAALKGYGLEIETENWNIIDANVYAYILEHLVLTCVSKDLFKKERDGSLCGGHTQAELITQIMTKEYIRNNYANFKELFNRFEQIGTSCVRSGNCGMHVNISVGCFGKSTENQDEAIRKLYYIVNHYYSLMCKLFMRDVNRTSYCRQMETSSFTVNDAKVVNYKRFGNDHGKAFNFSHNGRIEIRIVSGQRNFATFRNTMECVFFLVQRVQKISWKDLDNFIEIFRGCNQYVYSRLSLLAEQGHLTTRELNKISDSVVREEYI